jgi:hypothetical protein
MVEGMIIIAMSSIVFCTLLVCSAELVEFIHKVLNKKDK